MIRWVAGRRAGVSNGIGTETSSSPACRGRYVVAARWPRDLGSLRRRGFPRARKITTSWPGRLANYIMVTSRFCRPDCRRGPDALAIAIDRSGSRRPSDESVKTR